MKVLSSIPDRTLKFEISIVRLSSVLPKNPAGFAISGQVIRSGTSVGANIEEAQNFSTKKEFIRGLTIALKEARETHYWLKIVKATRLINKDISSLMNENVEIIKILTTSIKNAKSKI